MAAKVTWNEAAVVFLSVLQSWKEREATLRRPMPAQAFYLGAAQEADALLRKVGWTFQEWSEHKPSQEETDMYGATAQVILRDRKGPPS